MRALFAIVAAVLLLAPAQAVAAAPRDARGFVDTIGVNVHLFYDDTSYGNFAMVKQRLQELGVRHVRDMMDPDRRQWFYDRVNSLAQAGIRSTLLACRLPMPPYLLDGWVSDAKNKIRASLDALEGANEPVQSQFSEARECQYWLWQLAKSDTYGSPLAQPILGPSVWPSDFSDEFGPVNALGNPGADTANFHPYPAGQKPDGPDYYPLTDQMADVRAGQFPGRSVPIQASETGYHDALNAQTDHPPVSQTAEAIYLPRLFFEYAEAGVQRAYTYELVDQRPDPERDEREMNFGLFENDWSYKPPAYALKNLIGFVDSPSGSSRTPLDYSITGAEDPDGPGTGGAVKDMLLQKADGSYWLAVWQDSTIWDTNARQDISNPSNIVTVTLPRTMSATGYRPTQGTGTYGSVRASSFQAGVPDDVLLIKLTD